ncbi:hypothetical protein WAI453_002914 [Rhynchosporium graminicola]
MDDYRTRAEEFRGVAAGQHKFIQSREQPPLLCHTIHSSLTSPANTSSRTQDD